MYYFNLHREAYICTMWRFCVFLMAVVLLSLKGIRSNATVIERPVSPSFSFASTKFLYPNYNPVFIDALSESIADGSTDDEHKDSLSFSVALSPLEVFYPVYDRNQSHSFRYDQGTLSVALFLLFQQLKIPF